MCIYIHVDANNTHRERERPNHISQSKCPWLKTLYPGLITAHIPKTMMKLIHVHRGFSPTRCLDGTGDNHTSNLHHGLHEPWSTSRSSWHKAESEQLPPGRMRTLRSRTNASLLVSDCLITPVDDDSC